MVQSKTKFFMLLSLWTAEIVWIRVCEWSSHCEY